MKTSLNQFILGAPRLFIKQYAYAWIIFIALWAGTLNISLVCLLIILVGMFLLKWQHLAWVDSIRSRYGSGKFYMDEPRVDWKTAARNILILLAAAAAVSWFLNGQAGLTSAQFFLIIVGFTLLYRNRMFFGVPTTYIVTASGVGVYFAPGHLDYRLFIKFNEIASIERCAYKKDSDWSCLSRTAPTNDGLLLVPKSPDGFADRIEKMYIIPQDVDTFFEQLPRGLR